MVLSGGQGTAPGGGVSPELPRSDPPRGDTAGELRGFFRAFIPGALILVLTFFMFQSAVDRHQSTLNAICESEAGWVQEQLEHGLDSRAGALERLAAEYSAGGVAWRGDALALVSGPLQFRGVLEYDTTLAVRGTTPEDLRLLSTLDARDDEARGAALRSALDTPGREAIVVVSAPLGTGERQVLVCAPVLRGATRSGWLVGVIRLRDLLDADLARTVRRGFSAAVFDGPTLLYGATLAEGGPGLRYAHDAAVLRGPLLWSVRLWPAEELAGRYESWAPGQLLVIGLLLAFFVALGIHLGSRRPALD